MLATFKKSTLKGVVSAPPSKSMAHRYLIGAALSGEKCTLSHVDYSEDILASIDCLKALGADIKTDKDTVVVESDEFMKSENPVLECRESGSTLRFFVPLALCLNKTVTLGGSERLFERPLDVYETLCKDNNFTFIKDKNSLTLCGNLRSGTYKIKGDISSQFITGLIFALVYLGEDSTLEIIPPFESKSYVNLTISALRSFGADVEFTDEYKIKIKASKLHSFSGVIEGDYSNAAFFDALNLFGGNVLVKGLDSDSLQGDRVYKDYFSALKTQKNKKIDLTDCPDLAPILFSIAAANGGGEFIGTKRLRIKESDRSAVMAEELKKFGINLKMGDNTVTVEKGELKKPTTILKGHNDHRIVMALCVLLTVTGGKIEGAEAVKKSLPDFFELISSLGIEVNKYES